MASLIAFSRGKAGRGGNCRSGQPGPDQADVFAAEVMACRDGFRVDLNRIEDEVGPRLKSLAANVRSQFALIMP